MAVTQERINVMRVITYDVAKIEQMILEENPEKNLDDITIEDCLERIEGWVSSDFSCGYGHEADVRDLIFQDENGEEL